MARKYHMWKGLGPSVTLFNRFKTNWKVRSYRPKVWRHKKLNLWNYGIFWGIMKERHLGKRPTCQELTFQGKLSLSRSPWLVICSCFGVLVQFCYSMLWWLHTNPSKFNSVHNRQEPIRFDGLLNRVHFDIRVKSILALRNMADTQKQKYFCSFIFSYCEFRFFDCMIHILRNYSML